MYDVIVIGAGPGGSSAARFAARAGLDVLAVDKRQEIGSPKRCGEFFAFEVFERDMVPPIDRVIAQHIHGMRLVAPSGKDLSARWDDPLAVVLERKQFDKYLATLAVRDGARVQARTTAESVERDGDLLRVTLSSRTEQWVEEARILICADGVDAPIARALGLAEPLAHEAVGSGAQFEMVGIEMDDPTIVTCWVGREVAGTGYAWLFPKGEDRANVGVGIPGSDPGTAITLLESLVASKSELSQGSILEVNAGTVPVCNMPSRLVCDGVMVVGDAARQANPIHAGGICEAMEAGRFAGETAANAINSGDISAKFLKEYEDRWSKGYGSFHHHLVRARRAMAALSDDDINYIVDRLSPEEIVEFVSGRGITRAALLFAGRPSLLRIFLQ